MIPVIFGGVLSLIALLTGVWAVGSSSSSWDFSFKDILRLRADACLYIWLICSTLFCLWHMTRILDLNYNANLAGLPERHVSDWFALHYAVSLLLTGAHFSIRIIQHAIPSSILQRLYFSEWGLRFSAGVGGTSIFSNPKSTN